MVRAQKKRNYDDYLKSHSYKLPKVFISYNTSLIVISSQITQETAVAHLASYKQNPLAGRSTSLSGQDLLYTLVVFLYTA